MKALALAALVSVLLNACATTVSVVEAPKQQPGSAAPRIALTACYVPDRYDSLKSGRRYAVAIWMNGASGIFAVEKAVFEGIDTTCDLKLVVNTMNSNLDVFAARSGRSLFALKRTFGVNPMPRLRAALLERFSGDAELVASVIAERPSAAASQAPVAAPAASLLPASDVDAPQYHRAERDADFAIVIGVENYSDLPKAVYAERDAVAFAAHVRALGVPARNLVLLTGVKAGRAALEKYVEQWLPRLVKPDSRVYFFFSGHGAPDIKTQQAYLVPWDGDPSFLESTAYPVKRLYEKLGKLPAKEVLVAMDSCFSGAGGRSVLAAGARPLVTKVDAGSVAGAVTALTASAAAEISGALDDRKHGAFTYFLLKGLNGAASELSAAGLHRYLTPLVQDEARRLNRDQTPQILGDGRFLLR